MDAAQFRSRTRRVNPIQGSSLIARQESCGTVTVVQGDGDNGNGDNGNGDNGNGGNGNGDDGNGGNGNGDNGNGGNGDPDQGGLGLPFPWWMIVIALVGAFLATR